MIIFGVIGILGIVCTFVLWCCVKVGKESDIEIENYFEEKENYLNREERKKVNNGEKGCPDGKVSGRR